MTPITLKHFFSIQFLTNILLSVILIVTFTLILNNQSYASLASYCNYETAEDLNGVIGGSKLISFSLFHLNARSLVKNQ